MQHKQSSTALLSAAAALTLISETQNAFRKQDVPLELATTALSKEGSFAFTCHVKYFICNSCWCLWTVDFSDVISCEGWLFFCDFELVLVFFSLKITTER